MRGIILMREISYQIRSNHHDDRAYFSQTGEAFDALPLLQVGQRPSKRTGMCNTVAKDGKVFMFGGVMDLESAEDDSDEDSDEEEGNFFDEMYTVNVEGERATWHLVNLTGKRDPNSVAEKKRRRKEKDTEEDEDNDMDDQDCDSGLDNLEIDDAPKTVTIESGNFTVSSTVGGASKDDGKNEKENGGEKSKDCFTPCGRFNSQMVYKGGNLYLFGGVVESGEKDITLKDFYSLDTSKMDSWNILIENDQMEWLGDGDNDDEEASDEEDDSDMDTD